MRNVLSPQIAANMFRVLLILCLSTIYYSTSAQVKKWSLKACVDYALQNNLSIQEQNLNVERNEITLNKNHKERLPNLNSSASHNYNFGRTIDPFTNSFVNQRIQSNSFSLQSNVLLYNGFRLQNTIKRTQNEVEVNEHQTEAIRNQISLNVVEAFLQVVFAENQLQIVQNQALSTLAQFERMEKLMEAGSVNKSSYLTLKAQVARDKWSIQSAEGNIRLAYVTLMQVMQMPDSENFEIDIPNMETIKTAPLSSLDEVIKTGLETIPEIKVAASQLLSANLGVDIAEAGMYPRLSMFGNLNTLYSGSRLERFNPQKSIIPIGFVDGTFQPVMTEITSYETKTTGFGKQLSDNFGQAVGLSLSIPIFNNHQVKTAIAEAKLNEKAGEINLERAKMQVKSDIARAYTDYENAAALYTSAVENEKAQKENYEFSQKRYEAGLLTAVELLVAKTNWTSALNELERSKFELIFSNTQVLLYQEGKVTLPIN